MINFMQLIACLEVVSFLELGAAKRDQYAQGSQSLHLALDEVENAVIGAGLLW